MIPTPPQATKPQEPTSQSIVKNERDYSIYIKVLIVLAVGIIAGFFASGYLLYNLIGLILLVLILISGAGLGFFISLLANKQRWVWIRRRMGSNLGIAKIFNRGMSAEQHIVNLNDDIANIKGNTYKLYSETVRPIPDNGAPTLYYRQGVVEPLHWDEVGHFENNAGLSFALLTKVKSLYQSAALAQFGNDLRNLILIQLLLSGIILVGLYVIYTQVSGVNDGVGQVYYILNHSAVIAGNFTR